MDSPFLELLEIVLRGDSSSGKQGWLFEDILVDNLKVGQDAKPLWDFRLLSGPSDKTSAAEGPPQTPASELVAGHQEGCFAVRKVTL